METLTDEVVVVLAPVANDAPAIVAMLEENGIAATVCADAPQCRGLIDLGAGALLMTEEALAAGDATAWIEWLSMQPPWSDLPVLILAKGGPSRLADLLETTAAAAGSVTVLERPIAAALLLRTVRVALNARRRQYQVRRLMDEQRRRQAQLEQANAKAAAELARRREAEEALGAWLGTALPHESRSAGRKWAAALVLATVAVALRLAVNPWVGDQVALATLYGVTAVVVWYAGVWPAIAVAMLGYVACTWLFVTPSHPFQGGGPEALVFLLFAFGAGLTIAIGVRLRQTQAQARINGRIAFERQRSAEGALTQRDWAETKARESDERLRVAIKNAGILLAQTDAELRYRWIHRPEGDALARTLLGRRDDEVDDSPAAEELLRLKRQVFQSGRGAAADLRLRSTGEDRAFAYTIEPLRDAAGDIVGVTTAAMDITDRKRAEDALRESEERARQQLAELDAIYDTAPVGLAVLDPDLRFRRINRRLAEINGRSVAAHLGRTVAEVLPGLATQAEEALRRVLASGRLVRVELKGRTEADPDDERIWDEYWSPLRDAAGQIAGVTVVADDVTDRRRQEQALQRNEALFRDLADNLPQLAWMTRSDGTASWYNRRWYEYTGTTSAEMQATGWRAVQHPEFADRVWQGFLGATRQGVPWEDTFPLRDKDGHYRWFLSRAFPIRDAAGVITRWFGTNTDITVLRETQDALHAAQRQVRQYAQELEKTVAERTAKLQETVQELEAFSYSIAHDMRAPLRSMIGYADLVCEEYGPALDQAGSDYLRRITISARRLDRLIQDVLDYSRIVREDLPLEPVDVRKLTLEVVDSYPNLLAARSCIQVDGVLPVVRGNRAALTQVLSNLLENAVKFVPRQVAPAVRVWAEPAGAPEGAGPAPWVKVSVQDNGIGIDPSVRPRLFQMFQRFTRPGLYEGTGIGLAIVRKAVDRMGGAIGVESAVGGGSRFWFLLPAAGAPPPSSSS